MKKSALVKRGEKYLTRKIGSWGESKIKTVLFGVGYAVMQNLNRERKWRGESRG